MELFHSTISFPILQFDNVAIQHTSPRFPTAFERVVLNIGGRFANDKIYGEISLKRIFEDILSVANPDDLLERTIDELVNIQAIQCLADYHNAETLLVKSLTLTNRGQRLFQDGMLSGMRDNVSRLATQHANKLAEAEEERKQQEEQRRQEVERAIMDADATKKRMDKGEYQVNDIIEAVRQKPKKDGRFLTDNGIECLLRDKDKPSAAHIEVEEQVRLVIDGPSGYKKFYVKVASPEP